MGLPEAFYRSAEVFARKWSHRLPVATPCVIIDKGGEVYLLGNAVDGTGSIAQAEHRHVRGSAAIRSHGVATGHVGRDHGRETVVRTGHLQPRTSVRSAWIGSG